MAARPAAGRTRGPEQSSFSIRHLSTAVATEHTRTTTTPAASSILFHCIPHHFGATHTKLQSAVRSLRCTPHHFPHHYEPPHHFVVATPTNLRHAEFAALLPGRIWIWSRPLRNRTLTHDIIMAFTFIPSTPPISYSFNFSFQRLDWPVGSGGLNISPLARWVVCPQPAGRTRGHGPGIKSPADSRIQQRKLKVVMAVSPLYGR